MAIYLRDGFRGTCTSPASGTGPYTGITAVAGYRSFATLADADQVLVGVRSATTWGESGVFTKSGGSTPTLSRTRIDDTINGTTSPYDWPPGTPLIIYSTLDGKDTASLLGANTWQQDQSFNGRKLRLSPDTQTYLYSQSNARMDFIVDNAGHTFLAKGASNENFLGLTWSDNGALAGPLLILDRISTSPSTSDALGTIVFQGTNSSGTQKAFAKLICQIRDATNGSEDSALQVQLQRAGADTYVGEWNDHFLVVFPNTQAAGNGILIGKSAVSLNAPGCELHSNGAGWFTCLTDPLSLNRIGSDGVIVTVYRDGVSQGGITCNGGVVAIAGGGFQHVTELIGRPLEEDWPRGTVLCSVDELLEDGLELHPKSYVSQEAGDPAVYGVWWCRDERGYPVVAAGGTARVRAIGPVMHGELLESSHLPGIARAQADRLVRDSTLAKARGSIVEEGQEALIPCTLMAG